MIGPSAPNGPPEPIEIADDNGLSSATFGVDAAAVDQNRLDRLGDAVAADPIRSVPRHQADDQRADHRNHNDERPEMVANGRHRSGREPAVEEDVREERDQREEDLRHVRGHDADTDGDRRDHDHAPLGGEIA